MEDPVMNWDQIQGDWKQFRGKVREKWGSLTDNDLETIKGQRQQLEGLLQQRYGYTKEQVKKAVDDWANGLS
jgi:uncharacterized protein YjbJ (UPF0337 family)